MTNKACRVSPRGRRSHGPGIDAPARYCDTGAVRRGVVMSACDELGIETTKWRVQECGL